MTPQEIFDADCGLSLMEYALRERDKLPPHEFLFDLMQLLHGFREAAGHKLLWVIARGDDFSTDDVIEWLASHDRAYSPLEDLHGYRLMCDLQGEVLPPPDFAA